jgi:hypothetical protein
LFLDEKVVAEVSSSVAPLADPGIGDGSPLLLKTSDHIKMLTQVRDL